MSENIKTCYEIKVILSNAFEGKTNMKIGRNAPCPCGSGKKYKKCCLNKAVTPPETLHYKRLSKVLDNIMPQLIDHGHAVYGEMASSAAMYEFFGWPEPDEFPDEETTTRAGLLFWPWFVFNWEYERMEDEDQILDGPEDTTIAEHFMDSKRIDLQSLEGKLIMAANRSPYSFLEIVTVQPGRSVQVRDVLTGAEVTVQEILGSEVMTAGDIIFGRVVEVDGVGMFLGMSANVLPPRVKPELIAFRRSLSRSRRRVTDEDLYEWDPEIREVFIKIDRTLHTLPELRNTDGDPMEFHKLIYDIESANLALEMLAPLCVTENIDAIKAAAEKDNSGNIRHAIFDWNRRENLMVKAMPNTVLGHIDIAGNKMTVAVNSAKRAETIRKTIEERLGAAATLRLDQISDLESMMKRADGAMPPENELMEHPEVQQLVEKMLRTHWNQWIDQEIPALGYKTPRQSARSADGREAVEALLLDAQKMATNDPDRSNLERELIADVRRRLRLDSPRRQRPAINDTTQLTERMAQIEDIITDFGNTRLNVTYTGFAQSLLHLIAGTDSLNIHRGRIEIWAAAIVYAIAQLNFLFSIETPNHLTPDELCSWFKVKKTTVSNKAAAIRTAMDLFYDDERFCAPHITRIFRFIEDENGFILPSTVSGPESGDMPAPLPLNPSSVKVEKSSDQANVPEKKEKKGSDRQLSLFGD